MVKRRKYVVPFGIALSSLPLMAWENYLGQASTKNPSAKITLDEDSIISAMLKKQAVYNNDFVRNTFYTWTTKEQIEELRKQPTLLTRNQSKKGELSLFDLALQDTAFSKYPIAKVLSQDKFKNKRFGWTSAWATVMGWQKEKYGDQLLKIILKDDAIIGSFNQNDKLHPFSFYDMLGDSLTLDFVIKNQDKIAVIYHLNHKKTKRTEPIYKRYGTQTKVKKYKLEDVYAAYREYVIMNENMIKSWSYGTQEIISKLNTEINLLKSIDTLVKTEKYDEKTIPFWETLPSYGKGQYIYSDSMIKWEKYDDDVLDYRGRSIIYYGVFRASTCIANDYYLLSKERLDAIVTTLQNNIKAQGPPLTSK
jgi:hypothetical protein